MRQQKPLEPSSLPKLPTFWVPSPVTIVKVHLMTEFYVEAGNKDICNIVKPVLSNHSKVDKIKVLNTGGSLM